MRARMSINTRDIDRDRNKLSTLGSSSSSHSLGDTKAKSCQFLRLRRHRDKIRLRLSDPQRQWESSEETLVNQSELSVGDSGRKISKNRPPDAIRVKVIN